MTHFYTYESRTVACCVAVSGSVRPVTPDCVMRTLSQIHIGECGKITQRTVWKKYVGVHICWNIQLETLLYIVVRRISQNYEKRVLASSCLSVCPHGTLGLPTGRIFVKFHVWVFFEKSVEKIQFSVKADKNNAYCAWRLIYSCDHISLSSS
jgi:hypothetical protein